LDVLRSLCRIQLSWRWATARRSCCMRHFTSPEGKSNMCMHPFSGKYMWIHMLWCHVTVITVYVWCTRAHTRCMYNTQCFIAG
jgi:hypothetical protein